MRSLLSDVKAPQGATHPGRRLEGTGNTPSGEIKSPTRGVAFPHKGNPKPPPGELKHSTRGDAFHHKGNSKPPPGEQIRFAAALSGDSADHDAQKKPREEAQPFPARKSTNLPAHLSPPFLRRDLPSHGKTFIRRVRHHYLSSLPKLNPSCPPPAGDGTAAHVLPTRPLEPRVRACRPAPAQTNFTSSTCKRAFRFRRRCR